ncbi:MAG TPA: two-component regulator propeller domain-containing protein, partial [Chitinophagaceae bacterium]
MRKKVLIALLLIVFSGPALLAQSWYFNHYQVERGLSNNAVICSLQDRQGFMWFGTKDGLNRFDGYTFKVFRHDRDDAGSIGGNIIYSLHEDRQGYLWVGTDRGLFRYDAATESFTPIARNMPPNVRDVQEDRQGRLWFIARLQIYRYDPAHENVKAFTLPGSYPATSLSTASDGSLWITTGAGHVGKYQPGTDAFTLHEVFTPAEATATRWIETLQNGGEGILLVGTSKHGARLFDTRTATVSDMALHDGGKRDVFVRDFIAPNPTEYWIATESGVFIYNKRTHRWVNLKKNYNDPYSLSDNAVYTLCRDKEGGIWAGTFFGGANYFPRQYTSFKKYFPQYGINSISGNAVREICQDPYGNLWIGTEDAGLNRLEAKTGHFTHFSPGEEGSGIAHSNIHALLINNGELWVGTFNHGLDVLDVKTGRVLRHYAAATHALQSDFIYTLHKTRSGTILAGTERGLYSYDKNGDDFTLLSAVPPIFFTALYEDLQGRLWAGTYNDGVYCLDKDGTLKGHYKNEPASRHSLAGNRVNQIFEDSGGALWIATEGGLSQLNHRKGEFTNYTTKSGFPSNIMYTVLEDAAQNLWISTSKGLVCFSPRTKKIKTYTIANGLLSDQFNYNSAFKDAAGRFYFGSVKGLVSFHPKEFLPIDNLPPVTITGFQVYDQELAINKKGSPLKRSISFTPTITLPHNQSSFSIDFAALSYTAPEMTEYAYKMEGLDVDWTLLKTKRKAYFTELAPGTYTFMVKASISSGIWNSTPAVLTIKVLPPFWKSRWAYLLYILCAAAIIYYAVHSYHRRAEEKNRRKLDFLELEKEKELYQAKLDFFTNVAHEIRTPLTLIKGPMEKVMKRAEEVPSITNNLRIMQRNTDRLLDLTAQLLDFRKIEIQGSSLEFTQADVREVLLDHYRRFKPAAEGRKVSFKLKAPAPLQAWVDAEALN